MKNTILVHYSARTVGGLHTRRSTVEVNPHVQNALQPYIRLKSAMPLIQNVSIAREITLPPTDHAQNLSLKNRYVP